MTTLLILLHRLRTLPLCWLVITLSLSASIHAQTLDIYTEDWPPVSYANAGKAEGMAVDVVQALQARLGSNQPIQVVPWARGYKAVLEEPNVMLFTMGRSEEREKLVVMLGPIAISNTALYTRKGNAATLRRLLGNDLRKYTVGAYRSSIFADTARKKGYLNIDQAATPQVIANMLLAKRFDLWVEGSLVVPSILKEIGHAPDEVEQVLVLDSLELYLAFSKKTPSSIIKAWEDALRWLKKEGTYAKIHQKWLPNDTPPMDVIRLGTSDLP